MNPALLQKQLKDNAADLDEFYKDLENWRNKLDTKNQAESKPAPVKDTKPQVERKKPEIQPVKVKFGLTDYKAWDKFDADAECEKIDVDENDESELSDECDEALRDEAYLEKEKGNQYVKNKMWDKAIECYTKAIKCFSYDPVFYANRGLCYLKTESYVKAEDDCTMSLKLDKTYVKAYQRRAAARKSLNKLDAALEDIVEVLNLEPNNKESQKELESLKTLIGPTSQAEKQRPVSKFTASRNQNRLKNPILHKTTERSQLSQTEKIPNINTLKQSVDNWSNSPCDIMVKTVKKPVHLRSKKPLKRIHIEEKSETNTNPKVDKPAPILNTDDLKIIEHRMSKDKKNETNIHKSITDRSTLYAPKNSVQFFAQWKHLNVLEHKYALLKLIEPENLSQVFQESMESEVFSEFLEILAQCFVKYKDETFSFLLNLSRIKRFSTLVMFMTDDDRNYLWMVIDHIRKNEFVSEEEVSSLMKKYELEK